MLSVPAPTRIPLGTLQVGGQKVELFLSPEWARYFQSLNSQVQANSATLAQSQALAAFLGDVSDVPDYFPAPPGQRGEEGIPGAALFMLQECADEQPMLTPPVVDGVYVPVVSKDAQDGVPALTGFKLNLKNIAGTITSWFTTAASAARTWTMPDKDGTVAMVSDFASPPAIGSTAPAAGSFTTVSSTGQVTSGGAVVTNSASDTGFQHFTATATGGIYYTGVLMGKAAGLNQSGIVGYAYDPVGGNSYFHLTPYGAAIGSKFKVSPSGALTLAAGFGCNGKAAQPAAASGGTLAGVIAALVANGILTS